MQEISVGIYDLCITFQCKEETLQQILLHFTFFLSLKLNELACLKWCYYTKQFQQFFNNLKYLVLQTLCSFLMFKKCPNKEFFLVRIWTDYGKMLTRKKSVFRHFSPNVSSLSLLIVCNKIIRILVLFCKWLIYFTNLSRKFVILIMWQ